MKHKLQINPILKRELMVGSRSIKMPLLIMGINLLLTLIVVFVMVIAQVNTSVYDYQSLLQLFPTLACLECGLLSLVVPVFTSSAISGERERQTLDIMLTTPVKPLKIVFGKLESAVIVTMMYIIASVPLLAISFVLGGMNWSALFFQVGMLFYLGIYVGSVGIFCSSVVKKSVAATILTIAIGIGIIAGTGIISGVWIGIENYVGYMKYGDGYNYKIGAELMVLMLNPYAPFFDFILRSVSGTSVFELWKSSGKSSTILQTIYRAWIPISMILNLLVSFGFLKLAARSVVATKTKKVKGKRKGNDGA
ncbi:MAG: ABC transporter permease subunit [Eubacteriales bacterium]|nr:ABC transporter permease subunit [Eubacteriales bacterium]